MADNWRRKLKQGAFNGVKVETLSVSKTKAQRFAAHKFIGADGQFAEMLGADPTVWDVECFVIGNDYMAQRDALEGVLDSPRLSTFVDPFRSKEFGCVVVTYSVTEGITSGLGWAMFSVTVEESAVSALGFASAAAALQSADVATSNSTTSALTASTDAYTAKSAAFTDFAKGTAAAVETWGEQVDDIQDAVFGPLSGSIDAIGDVANALTDLEAGIASLIATPAALIARFTSVWDQIASLGVVKAFTRDRSAAAPATASTASAQAALDAASAAERASLATAVARQSTLTTAESYDSADDALSARDDLLATIAALQAAADANEYQAWLDLRAMIASWADTQAARLPELVDIAVNVPTPSLVLAQRYYQDAARGDEIVERNIATVIHPGFANGDLRILSSGVP